MQTVNFQCGHCNKLMAVSTDFLGQQVRCPHCQQVVVAPAAPAPVPAPTPAFLPPTIDFTNQHRGEQDSIFSPPEPSDDLFDSPAAPRLEMPALMRPAPDPQPPFLAPEPPPPPPQLEATVISPLPPLDSTLAYVPGGANSPDGDGTAILNDGPAGPAVAAVAPEPESTLIASVPESFTDAPSRPISRPVRTKPAAGGHASLIVTLSLLSYSILTTILLIVIGYNYWMLATRPNNVLDKLPDLNGDNPGVKKKEQASWTYDKSLATAPLPAHLRVKLGETLRIGDLEVKPTKVEQKTVKVHVEGIGADAEPCRYQSLVLTLQLHNLANNYSFTPLDNYFDRNWKDQVGQPPLTVLQVGKHLFYGGPARWYNRKRDPKLRLNREWVDGRQNFDDQGVAPGGTTETFTCTDGENSKVALTLAEYQGPLLWRVHLRRGLAEYKGKRIATTAVIGVEFSDKDIEKVVE